jgi:hypothetical protein
MTTIWQLWMARQLHGSTNASFVVVSVCQHAVVDPLRCVFFFIFFEWLLEHTISMPMDSLGGSVFFLPFSTCWCVLTDLFLPWSTICCSLYHFGL